MGWEGQQWSVAVTLDAHGGEREQEDEELWRELQARLTELVRDSRYAGIVWNPPDEIEYEECGEEELDSTYNLPCRLPRGHRDRGPDGTRQHEAALYFGSN